jgi:hypothetical protein
MGDMSDRKNTVEIRRKRLLSNKTPPPKDDREEEGGSGTEGRGDSGRGRIGRGDRERPEGTSFLVDETRTMERERRLQEQQGHKQLAKVNAREHPDEERQNSLEGELQNDIMQHPWLDSQNYDGVDPNLNPEPPLNTEARREYDNERREQEKEKQLRLGNMPKFSTAPKPQGP